MALWVLNIDIDAIYRHFRDIKNYEKTLSEQQLQIFNEKKSSDRGLLCFRGRDRVSHNLQVAAEPL